jgi:hypothetical protein
MAKITTEYNMKERLEQLVEFVQERVTDPMHSTNHDIIADFLDRFLVVELKRAGHSPGEDRTASRDR